MVFVIAFIFIVGELLDGVATEPPPQYNRVTTQASVLGLHRVGNGSIVGDWCNSRVPQN